MSLPWEWEVDGYRMYNHEEGGILLSEKMEKWFGASKNDIHKKYLYASIYVNLYAIFVLSCVYAHTQVCVCVCISFTLFL